MKQEIPSSKNIHGQKEWNSEIVRLRGKKLKKTLKALKDPHLSIVCISNVKMYSGQSPPKSNYVLTGIEIKTLKLIEKNKRPEMTTTILSKNTARSITMSGFKW